MKMGGGRRRKKMWHNGKRLKRERLQIWKKVFCGFWQTIKNAILFNLEDVITIDVSPLLMHTSVDSLDVERVQLPESATQFTTTTTTASEGQRMETSVDSLELDLARKEMGEGGDDSRDERDSLEGGGGGQMSHDEA